jgi:hypothetical protein
MSTEFTLGEPMQLGIKGSKQCFRGGPIPSFGCDNQRRDCRSHVRLPELRATA